MEELVRKEAEETERLLDEALSLSVDEEVTTGYLAPAADLLMIYEVS